jgi:hypothetical protein
LRRAFCRSAPRPASLEGQRYRGIMAASLPMFVAVVLLLGAPQAAETTSEKPVARNSTLAVSNGAGIPTQHIDMAALGDEDAATASEPDRQHERFSSVRGDTISRGGDSLSHRRLQTVVVPDDDLAGGGGDRRRLQSCSQTNEQFTPEECNAQSNCHIETTRTATRIGQTVESTCSCSCVAVDDDTKKGMAGWVLKGGIACVFFTVMGILNACCAKCKELDDKQKEEKKKKKKKKRKKKKKKRVTEKDFDKGERTTNPTVDVESPRATPPRPPPRQPGMTQGKDLVEI